ncbi:MAG: lytic transglycosylase domain-containing protein, partial [Patescibacteria group bacterium]
MASRFVGYAVFLFALGVFIQPAFGQQKDCKNIEISPSFIGGFKKAARFEQRILELANFYGIDPDAAMAVMIYESGGNEGLVSSAGAEGLMQVMPSTAKMIKEKYGISDNLEAGMRYLKDLSRIFDGDMSLVIAAYNGGPGRVGRGEFRLETLQYLMGVSSYYHILKRYKPCLRETIAEYRLQFLTVNNLNDSWEKLSATSRVPVLELRMLNPFLSNRILRPGMVVVYPQNPVGLSSDIIRHSEPGAGSRLWYKIKLGDVYHHLA